MEVIIASVYCFHSEFSFPYIYQNLVTMNKYNLLLFAAISLVGCKENEPETSQYTSQMETEIRTYPTPVFTLDEANNLIDLPLHCVGTPYPSKAAHVSEHKEEAYEPIVVCPTTHGCFDWHSAAHGN